MENNYEIIGNQIKFYFKGDTSHMWNNIPSPQLRTVEEIVKVCRFEDTDLQRGICAWDYLNEKMMSQTEVTDFLYRWATAYVKTVGDGITNEAARIDSKNILPDAAYQALSDFVHYAAHVSILVMDCIMHIGGVVWSLLI